MGLCPRRTENAACPFFSGKQIMKRQLHTYFSGRKPAAVPKFKDPPGILVFFRHFLYFKTTYDLISQQQGTRKAPYKKQKRKEKQHKCCERAGKKTEKQHKKAPGRKKDPGFSHPTPPYLSSGIRISCTICPIISSACMPATFARGCKITRCAQTFENTRRTSWGVT